MVVELGDCLVGDGPGKLCGLRLLTLRERLVAFRQVAAAREHDAFALRQQHVVDAELLEASFAVEPVPATGLPLGERHPLTRRDDAGNANARFAVMNGAGPLFGEALTMASLKAK